LANASPGGGEVKIDVVLVQPFSNAVLLEVAIKRERDRSVETDQRGSALNPTFVDVPLVGRNPVPVEVAAGAKLHNGVGGF
jgi:hypothetical protein